MESMHHVMIRKRRKNPKRNAKDVVTLLQVTHARQVDPVQAVHVHLLARQVSVYT